MDTSPAQPGTRTSELGTFPHRLIVFSDDWGRHPSSCQHLVGQLLSRYETLWVNTIGTRSPRLSWEDVGKAVKKIGQWIRPPAREVPASVTIPSNAAGGQPAASALTNLTVLSPRMFPGFRKGWQRRLNRRLITRAIHKALGPRQPGEQRTAITTIPITADLPRHDANDVSGLDVDRWIFYCVDDFSVWPGLDGSVLDAMDRDMALRSDAIIAVSQTLRDRIQSWGRESTLLTHGIDLAHWTAPSQSAPAKPMHSCAWVASSPRPIFLFWGVVDQRLDTDWCLSIANDLGTLVLLGPQQSPDARLLNHPRIVMPGPAPYTDLPWLASQADVLVMPYADLPVTRAIQPLKFKEYLATGKPVIARQLPATIEWSDAADVVGDVETMLSIARARLASGLPASQQASRQRLEHESWTAKAAVFESIIRDASPPVHV